jgi:hypothetical protein
MMHTDPQPPKTIIINTVLIAAAAAFTTEFARAFARPFANWCWTKIYGDPPKDKDKKDKAV